MATQSAYRPSGEGANREQARAERVRDCNREGEKERDESLGGLPAFQVLGHELSLSTAADDKRSTPVVSAAASGTATVDPTAAAVTTAGADGVHNRRSSRAAAVAATLAAVASAKAATDDAVASVSSTSRHRSVGTSISGTLTITSVQGGSDGDSGGCLRDRREAVDREDSRCRQPAWPERAPGKEDGGITGAANVAAGNGHREHKWHKRVAGTFAGADADHKAGEGRGSVSGGERRDEKGFVAAAAASAVEPSISAAPSDLITTPWLPDSREGARLDGVGASAGGGDSPPLLGSAEPPPALTHHNPESLPSQRQQDDSRGKETIAVATRPAMGFPVAATAGSSVLLPGAIPAGGAFDDGVGVGADCRRDNGAGDAELGMTRPRTATRRWDRPGPPGEDEVLAKTLLSRAAVTSALSNR